MQSNISLDLRNLFNYISQQRRLEIFGLFILMLLGAVAEMGAIGAILPFLALISSPKTDENSANGFSIVLEWLGWESNQSVLTVALIFSLVVIIAAIIRLLLTWVSLRISFGVGGDLGGKVYKNTLNQPYIWHMSNKSSEIIASLEKVNNVIGGVLIPILNGMSAIIITIFIVVALLFIDWKTATLSALFFVIVYCVISVVLKRRLSYVSKIISHNLTKRIQCIQEGIGGIRDVILDSAQPIHCQKFTTFDQSMRNAQAISSLIASAPRSIIEAVGMVLIVALAYWVSEHSNAGPAEAIPILGALAVGAQKLLPLMQMIYSSWSSLNSNKDQLRDVLYLLNTPNELFLLNENDALACKNECNPSCNKKFIVEFKNVSFRFEKTSPWVIRSLNVTIEKGSFVGIIGTTGSGKTTFVDLLMGLLDATEGLICIDGNKLDKKNIRSWQKRIAHVPQNIYLSDSDFKENIAFGVEKNNIDFDRVKISAKKAQLSEFIEGLKDKYDTKVGENGVRLSGGQRQRIGLARALYKNADILVLDEATSALDNNTEKAVMEEIENLGDEISVIIIAHRLSTVAKCDRVIQLENGKIIADTPPSVINIYP